MQESGVKLAVFQLFLIFRGAELRRFPAYPGLGACFTGFSGWYIIPNFTFISDKLLRKGLIQGL